MEKYISGTHVEDRLHVRLEKLGCKLTESKELNHTYKIDFIITSFEGIDKMRPVGVQVTTRMGDRDKMREFRDVQKTTKYVDRVLYVELGSHAIEQGVDRLVYSAIIFFAYSVMSSDRPIGAVRIRPDMTIEFFDLDAEIAATPGSVVSTEIRPPLRIEARGEPRPAPTPVEGVVEGQRYRGVIKTIDRRGYGFIESTDTVTHFFPFTGVKDRALFTRLEEMQLSANPRLDVEIAVTFMSRGHRRPNARHPIAGEVMAAGEGMDAEATPAASGAMDFDEDAGPEDAQAAELPADPAPESVA